MQAGSITGNITGTYTAIGNYSNPSNLSMPTDEVAGTIQVPTGGKYRMTANISINYNNIGNNKPLLTLGIYNGSSIIAEAPVTVTKDSEGYSLFPSLLFTAVAGTFYSLQIKCTTDLVAPTFDMMSFELESTSIK